MERMYASKIADWVFAIGTALQKPLISGGVGVCIGWLAKTYFKPLLEGLAKNHVERLKIHSQEKVRKQKIKQREEQSLDGLEVKLVALVHQLEDSLQYGIDSRAAASCLAQIRDFYRPHNGIGNIKENREFLRDYTAHQCIDLVSRGLADAEIPRIVKAARQLRIRLHRSVKTLGQHSKH